MTPKVRKNASNQSMKIMRCHISDFKQFRTQKLLNIAIVNTSVEWEGGGWAGGR